MNVIYLHNPESLPQFGRPICSGKAISAKKLRKITSGVIPPSGPTLVANTSAGSVGGGDITTSGIDTSGANLLVVYVSWYPGATANVAVSDSKGNTWIPLTAIQSSPGGPTKGQLFYCVPTSVGSAHTFTSAGIGTFSSIFVQAFSGMNASPFDVENGTGQTFTSSTIQPGSVTPSSNNSVIITGWGCSQDYTNLTIDLDWTLTDKISAVGGNHLAGGIAYKLLPVLAATNPTWNAGSGLSEMVSVIAVFKSA
jgi:hypothetical protein